MNEDTIKKLNRDLYDVAVVVDRLHQTLNMVRQELAAAYPKAVEEGPVKILQEQTKAKRDEGDLIMRALADREGVEGGECL
jgi:hypothetical protein